MSVIRRLLLNNGLWFAVLFALALAVKALVPSGYMISSDSKTITVMICNGAEGAQQTIAIPLETGTGSHHSGSDNSPEVCASGSFSQSTMTMTDPIQLAMTLAFIMLAGLVIAVAIPSARPVRWRPPLRGPPAFD